MTHRYFKISISLLPIHIYGNTRAYLIKNKLTLIALSTWYTLVTLLLGWWGVSLRHPLRNISHTLEALHINVSGGSEFSDEIEELEFSDKTNYIWNNLLRETCEKISREEVDLVLEIQETFEESNSELYSEENLDYIIANLGAIDIHRISRNSINDVFDGIQLYKKHIENEYDA